MSYSTQASQKALADMAGIPRLGFTEDDVRRQLQKNRF